MDAAGFPAVSILVTSSGPLEVWTEYREARAYGISSQRAYGQAIGLFIDFLAAFGAKDRVVNERHKFFRAFADALIKGTVQDGNDPSNLFWLPRTRAMAGRIVDAVTDFADWLIQDQGVKPLNPIRGSTIAEQIAFWRAWQHGSARSLKKHIKVASFRYGRRPPGELARAVKVRGQKPNAVTGGTKAFPEELFVDLLKFGFRRHASLAWTSLRDQMIALLLHEGGLRISEALHLWADDVFASPEDPTAAVVRVYEPREGLRPYENPITGKTQFITRAEYLRLVYGRVPLTELPGRKRVGWKDPLLSDADGKFLTVFWRSNDAARAFLKLYLRYVQLRRSIKKHPYLFITDSGEPMVVRAYEKVHAAAVRRIGLVAAKNAGTTPHGHRHAYGKSLRRNKIPQKVCQVAMHHKSVFSQEIYTEADADEVIRSLRSLELNSKSILLDLPLTPPQKI